MSPSGVTVSTSSNESSQPDDHQHKQQLPPRPPGLPNGLRHSHEASSTTSQRASRSLEQAPAPAGSGGQAKPSRLQEAAGQSQAASSAPGSHAGSKGSGGSSTALDTKACRASFAIDNLEPDHPADLGTAAAASSYAGSNQGPGSAAGSILNNQLQDGSHRAANHQRSSIDSVASKASSTGGSKRSSFALEAERDGGQSIEMDHYGRPSFAPFEKAMAARGELKL